MTTTDTEERRMFVTDDGYRAMVGCCGCGFANLHPVEVRVNRGGVVTTVEHGGERTDPGGKPAGRGVEIAITYHCECGAKFADVQHFHKGNTYIERVVHEMPSDDDDGEELVMRETIWRD